MHLIDNNFLNYSIIWTADESSLEVARPMGYMFCRCYFNHLTMCWTNHQDW